MSVTRIQKRWPFVVGGIVLLLVIAIVIAYVTGAGRGILPFYPSTTQDIGQGVTVEGDKLPDGLKATVSTEASPIPESQANLNWYETLLPQLNIEPSGPLNGPTTFTFPLKHKLADGEQLVIMTNPTHPVDANGWQSLPATVSPDGLHASVVVDHLSSFFGIGINVNVVKKVINDLINEVGAGAFSEATPPKCDGTDKAKTDGYSINVDYADANTAFWCFGYEKTDRLVRVVNNRRYPLEIESVDAPAIDTGDLPVSMVEAYRLHHLVIMPREAMTFAINPLKVDSQATLKGRLSNWGLGLQFVNIVATAIVTLAVGPESNPQAAAHLKQLIEAVLSAQECTIALDSQDVNFPKLVNACFVRPILAAVFGVAMAVILGPVILVFSALDFGRAFLNATGDRQNNRDRYNITVSRKKLGIPTTLVGSWTAHSAGITINADGTGMSSERDYQSTCGDYCQYNAELKVLPVNDHSVRVTVTRIWYEVNLVKVPTPTTPNPTLLRQGETELLELDEFDRLLEHFEGRMADRETNYFCGSKTPQAQKAVCGA